MSQHDFNIANQSFPATRTDLNNALVALASNSSGDAEPATKYANQWWYETDTNTLKLRNEANDAWISIAVLDQSGNAVQSITTAGLTLGSTAISATGTEINQLDAITRGSILYGNASGATARLAAGGASTVLTSDGTDISWVAAGGGGGGLEFITSIDVSGSTNVDFTGFDSSKYDSYLFTLGNLTTATDDAKLYIQTSSDTSSHSYDSGNFYSTVATVQKNNNNAVYIGEPNSNPAYFLCMNVGSASGLEADAGVSGTVELLYPHLTKYTQFVSSVSYVDSSALHTLTTGAGFRKAAAAVNAVRFKFDGHAFNGGTITMYGRVNS